MNDRKTRTIRKTGKNDFAYSTILDAAAAAATPSPEPPAVAGRGPAPPREHHGVERPDEAGGEHEQHDEGGEVEPHRGSPASARGRDDGIGNGGSGNPRRLLRLQREEDGLPWRWTRTEIAFPSGSPLAIRSKSSLPETSSLFSMRIRSPSRIPARRPGPSETLLTNTPWSAPSSEARSSSLRSRTVSPSSFASVPSGPGRGSDLDLVFFGQLFGRHRQDHRFPVPQDLDRHLPSHPGAPDDRRKVRRALDGLFVEREHDVSDLDARAFGRAAGEHPGDERAPRPGHPERLGKLARHVLDQDAEPSPGHAALVAQLVHDVHRDVDGDREREAHEPSGAAEDLRIHPDDLALQIEQRAPEFPGLIATSVWMNGDIALAGQAAPLADTMPAVTE